MSIAMVFPGQGSQSQGMQAELAARFPEVLDVYGEASEILGFDLFSLVQNGPAEKLGETVITQPAMLTAGYAAYRAWRASGGETPSQLAGHSLGEYTALVCAGALTFADAVRVVQTRAELMQAAVPVGEGAMAAVLGLDDAKVAEVCEQAPGVVEPVNFNSPGQVVIAGTAAAVANAIELATDAGARRALLLPVSVPSHSSLLTDAGVKLAESLAETDFGTPAITVVAATNAQPYTGAADIRTRLAEQVYSPVRWVDTTKAMLDAGATRIIECGPGKVLAGLMRRIDKRIPVAAIDDYDGLQKALQS